MPMLCLDLMLSCGRRHSTRKCCLVSRNVFPVVDGPADRNTLGTTMIYKYNIDRVKNAVTSKCHLCLHGEWQRKVSTSLNTRHSVQFSTVAHCMLWTLYALAAANSWYMFCSDITQAFTYGKLDVLLYCLQPPGFERPKDTIFGLNYCLSCAKQAPACFKAVLTEFMLSEGFTQLRQCGSSAKSSLFPITPRLLMTYIIAPMILQCIAHLANDWRKSSI